ncbi:hypothetical protein ACS0TY_007783 [Phlomoides rotata]
MGEEEELKAVLREAFGDSSSESDGETSCDSRRRRGQVDDSRDEVVRPLSIFGDTHIWEPVTEINGLWICRDFLSADKQSSLLSALEKEGYLTETSHNQAMRFGDLPPWALELSYVIRENVLFSSHFSESMDLMSGENNKEPRLFPPELLWREPLFNQFIVNIYQPGEMELLRELNLNQRGKSPMEDLDPAEMVSQGKTGGRLLATPSMTKQTSEGIRAHVDLMRFEDGIAIISLESSCIMHFRPVEAEGDDHLEEIKKDGAASAKIPVLLTPGSLILMWGEARYLWKHEINRKPGYQICQGKEIEQKRRTSVTLRRLCETE